MATIQDRRRDRTGIMFVLTVLTILMVVGVIIFTAISAMASTEAGPAEQGSNSDGKNAEIVVGGAVSEVVSKEAGKVVDEAVFEVISKEAGDDSYIIIDGKKVNKEEVNIIEEKDMTPEQLNFFRKVFPKEIDPNGISICRATFYRKKILGIIPRKTTLTIFFKGVDFSKFQTDSCIKGGDLGTSKIVGMDCEGEKCKKELKELAEEWGKDIIGLKVRCPLKDGEIEAVLRKN